MIAAITTAAQLQFASVQATSFHTILHPRLRRNPVRSVWLISRIVQCQKRQA